MAYRPRPRTRSPAPEVSKVSIFSSLERRTTATTPSTGHQTQNQAIEAELDSAIIEEAVSEVRANLVRSSGKVEQTKSDSPFPDSLSATDTTIATMPSLEPQPQEAINLLRTAAPDATNNDILKNQTAKDKINHSKTNGINTSLAIIKPYATSLAHEAITIERQLYVPRDGDALIDPGTARVNIAVSNETPDGTPEWREKHAHQTVLQQHCGYWDPDNDGIIWPADVYRGCAAWGWNAFLCILATVIIAGSMSYPTLPRGHYLPDLRFRIYLNNIHKCKHGSDSNTYDSEGRFRPQQFEDFFAKYDAGNKGGVDLYDLARAHKGQRLLGDPFGWTAGILEWLALYLLIWPQDGILRKDDCRASYDGSIFQKKADDYAARKTR